MKIPDDALFPLLAIGSVALLLIIVAAAVWFLL